MNTYVWVFLGYVLVMLAIGFFSRLRKNSLNELNIAGGSLGWVSTGFSIAATWIWAPALFVASQRAYQDGVLGFGWFFVPNVLALILFAFVARKALFKRRSNEHTIAELISNIYNSRRLKFLHDFELLVLAFCSVGVQLLAGGLVLYTLTGINFTLITVILAVVALIYSALAGIRASVRTDFLQMGLILVAIVPLLYYTWGSAPLQWGGIDSLSTSFFSTTNMALFIGFGLATTIGLLSGPIGDQTFWQRAFGMRKEYVFRSYMLGALIFALVPIATSILGFMAAGAGFIPNNVSMVGLEYALSIVPTFVVILFVLMILSGLSSTLDSKMCAVGSIFSKFSNKTQRVSFARLGMVIVAILGIIVSNIPNINIFWLFVFYGVLRSSVFIPTLWTMFAKRLPSEKALFYGILGAFLIGVPTYVFGAVAKYPYVALAGTLMTVLIPLMMLLADRYGGVFSEG